MPAVLPLEHPHGPKSSSASFFRTGSSESQRSRSAQQQVARVAELRRVHEAFAWFRSHARDLEELQLQVTAVPAPPWGEDARSRWLAERFSAMGLSEVHRDELGNVFGIRPGTDPTAPFIALSAHIDTVFPPDTPIVVRRDNDKLYGPGISDNSSGITALLAIAGALACRECRQHRAATCSSATSARKAKAICVACATSIQQPRWSATIASLIVVDGAGTDTIIAEGLGSRRYEVTVRGQGGHSWSDFGVANPIVALARMIDRFTRTPVPVSPKTTFNVGTIHGGTSVNSIPEIGHACASIRARLR